MYKNNKMYKKMTLAALAVATFAAVAAPMSAAYADADGRGPGPAYGYTGPVTVGGTLPAISGQGDPESVNSLPPGFESGTLALQHRQALRNFWGD